MGYLHNTGLQKDRQGFGEKSRPSQKSPLSLPTFPLSQEVSVPPIMSVEGGQVPRRSSQTTVVCIRLTIFRGLSGGLLKLLTTNSSFKVETPGPWTKGGKENKQNLKIPVRVNESFTPRRKMFIVVGGKGQTPNLHFMGGLAAVVGQKRKTETTGEGVPTGVSLQHSGSISLTYVETPRTRPQH